jgi:hypothetical protein
MSGNRGFNRPSVAFPLCCIVILIISTLHLCEIYCKKLIKRLTSLKRSSMTKRCLSSYNQSDIKSA